MNDTILLEFDGLFCTECKTLCYPYEEGTCCACGPAWETRVSDYDVKYPAKWIPCTDPAKWIPCTVEVKGWTA